MSARTPRRENTEKMDFSLWGYRAYGPKTVPIVTNSPDTERVLAVSVPIEWEVERDEEDNLILVGRTPVMRIAETVNIEAKRRAGGTANPDDAPPVSNAGLRGAFHRRCEAGEDNPAALAARLGWTRQKDGEQVPDRGKVLDMLGIARERKTIPYDTAALICEAMQLDPTEVGL